MPELENIGVLEKRLWKSADTPRSNSKYASNEYFLPVMGLIFLSHAYSRFLRVREEIKEDLPTRSGETRPLKKEDFTGRGAIYLSKKAQFDHLAGLPDSEDRAEAVVQAMESIEEDYETLDGELPKSEYQKLDNEVLGQLLRTFNDPALRMANGDVFGRIYEYFLTQFADQEAHAGGEFFTPMSLVQTIVNVIEPGHGKILDPASGSGGMFVQSAHFIERMEQNPTSRATFYGLEKNETTIRLAKMNLAVHGLEGNIASAITYYDDLIEVNEERIQRLERAARLLYREWFVRLRFPGHEHATVEDGVPEGWERVAASDIIEVKPKVPTVDGEIRYVPMAAVPEGNMTIDPSETRVRKKFTSTRFRNSDVLFARITPCLENGKTAFVQILNDDEVACGSTEFIVLRGDRVSPEFTYCLSRTHDFRQNAIKSMTGSSGRQRVQTECFDRFELGLPPQYLLEEFDAQVKPCFEQIRVLQQQNIKLREARDLLLPRLMNGEITV